MQTVKRELTYVDRHSDHSRTHGTYGDSLCVADWIAAVCAQLLNGLMYLESIQQARHSTAHCPQRAVSDRCDCST